MNPHGGCPLDPKSSASAVPPLSHLWTGRRGRARATRPPGSWSALILPDDRSKINRRPEEVQPGWRIFRRPDVTRVVDGAGQEEHERRAATRGFIDLLHLAALRKSLQYLRHGLSGSLLSSSDELPGLPEFDAGGEGHVGLDDDLRKGPLVLE